MDYLFLQVWPDRAEVSDQQNCGNILAGIGPFAIERGLVAAQDGVTPVSDLHGQHRLEGDRLRRRRRAAWSPTRAKPASMACPEPTRPIMIDFEDVAGSSCGALLPTGNAVDVVDGIEVTCIDNGMPVVCLAAADLGVTGYETPAELEANADLKDRVERIRLAVGPMMNLGDVTNKTVPKMSLLAPARDGGLVATRTFIPHRVHESIGVLGAVSVATACMIEGSVAARIAGLAGDAPPTSRSTSSIPAASSPSRWRSTAPRVELVVTKSALLRTARLLMSGDVHVSTPPGELT